MSSGQLLLTIGALVTFSTIMYNVNRNLAQTDISLAQNRYRFEALALLKSYKEQTLQHFFDEVSTDTTSDKKLSDFTHPSNLGFDANDHLIMDDFDDYHNYTISDTTQSGMIYQLAFKVDYIKVKNNQPVTSNRREFHKRMEISIIDHSNDLLLYKWENGHKVPDTLRISFIKSYWFYN